MPSLIQFDWRWIAVSVLFAAFAPQGSVADDESKSAAEQPNGDSQTPAELQKAAGGVVQTIAHRGSSADRPENTLAAYKRAIEAGATAIEVDVRTSKDGVLVVMHDESLERTTDGEGAVGEKTLEELKQLDAGGWFGKEYEGERIPTLEEVLKAADGKVDVLLDLKETGNGFAMSVAATVKKNGDPKRTIVGVRTMKQADLFRLLLPDSTRLGLIPEPDAIEEFSKHDVEVIRLWSNWIEKDPELVERVKKSKAKLHLNGATGKPEEVRKLLVHRPDSLSSDDPATLKKTLQELAKSDDGKEAKKE